MKNTFARKNLPPSFFFSVSYCQIQTVQKNMKIYMNAPNDKSSNHVSQLHAIKKEVEKLVLDHINSFPSQSSHNSRNKSKSTFL